MSTLRIAHRGGAGLQPENSLSAFADAIARGLDGGELDVQLSRDGHAVVFHDFCLKPDLCRVHGRWVEPPTAKIVDLDLAELQTVEVGRARPGSPYARLHPLLRCRDGEHVPLLADVVALARRAPRPFRLFVELKSSFTVPGLSAPPGQLAEKAFAVVAAEDFVDRTIFVGFDWRALLAVKALAPCAVCWFTTLPQSWFHDAPPPPQDDPPAQPVLQMLRDWAVSGTSPWAAGFDAVKFGGSILEAIGQAGGDGWFPAFRDASGEQIARAHRMGLKVGAWTVNDLPGMRALAANGIDAICTDRSDLIMTL